MDTWESRGGKSQTEKRKEEEDQRKQRARRRKMQARKKADVVFNFFVARKVER